MAIDRAIAAAEEPKRVAMAQLVVTLPTGRKAALHVPIDLTMAEAFHLLGFISTQLAVELAKGQRPSLVQVPPGVRVPRT